MLPQLAVAGLLLGHALIHGGYISRRPPAKAGAPAWPFELERSWLLRGLGIGPGIARLVGTALVAATIGAFVLSALAAVGIVPASWWAGSVVVGAVASLGVLLTFFHPWLVLGVAIDLVLLWGVIVGGWSPGALAA